MASFRLAEATLERIAERQSHDLPLGQIIEALPAAVYTTDAEGRLVHYNQAAVELWGREPDSGYESWCGSWQLYHTDGTPMPHDTCPMARALKSGQPIRGEEAVAERPDGSRVIFLAFPTPLYGSTGELVGAVNMLIDITDRKAIEDKLRRRETELTDFVENTTIGLHWVGPDGTILWANRAEMKLLGYAPGEYIGHHITDFHADRPVIDDILERLARHEVLKDFEARMRCKDGSIKHVLIDSSVYLENGQFKHTRCFTRDISGQKTLERRLAVSASISQILSESNTMDEAMPQVLETLAASLGADIAEYWSGKEEMRCVAFHSRLPKRSVAPFRKAAEQLALPPGKGLPGRVWQAGEPLWLENVISDKDFARVESAAILGLGSGVGIPVILGGRCLGVITCLMREPLKRDPTLVRTMMSIGLKVGQFVERTRETEANRYLATIVNASMDGVIGCTLDDVIISWNPGAERIFGYTAEETLGTHISIILPKSAAGVRRRRISRLKKGLAVEPFETERRAKSGQLIPVSMGYSPIRDAKGKLVAVAAIVRDISTQKAVAAQLSARILQLQAVSELGLLALAREDLDTFLDEVVTRVAHALDVEFTNVLELQPGGHSLLLRAGVGWRKGIVGEATVPVTADTLAGYTLSADEPVIVEDLPGRFKGSRVLRDHRVVSGLSVAIRGKGSTPYGVLGAFTTRPRRFTANDVHFVQSVANILATAIEAANSVERQQVLVRELTHRVKNILSVVQAIAIQAGGHTDTIEDFMLSFEGRIVALSQAHDLLTANDWEGAGISELAKVVLGSQLGTKRLRLDIEDIKLSTGGVQMMVMLFHELMTNAVKYGALSNDKGKVTLRGRRKRVGSDACYTLSWRESGGPRVSEPNRYGFGTKLITRTVRKHCGGTLEVDWRPQGLKFDCSLPQKSIT